MKRFVLILLSLAAIATPAIAALTSSAGNSGPAMHARSLKSILPMIAGEAESDSKNVWMSAVRLEQSVSLPEPGSLLLMGSGLLVGAIGLRKRLSQDSE